MIVIPKNFDLTGKTTQQLQTLRSEFREEIRKMEESTPAKKLAKDQRYQELKRLSLWITSKLEGGETSDHRVRRQPHRRAA